VNQATASITVANTATIINANGMIAGLIIVIETIEVMIMVNAMTRT
jgi:hypothetical protein